MSNTRGGPKPNISIPILLKRKSQPKTRNVHPAKEKKGKKPPNETWG